MTLDALDYSKSELKEYLAECNGPEQWKEAVRYIHMLIKDGARPTRGLNIWEFAVHALLKPMNSIQYVRSKDIVMDDQAFIDDAICALYEKNDRQIVEIFMVNQMQFLTRNVWDRALSPEQKISMCDYQENIPLSLEERQAYLLEHKEHPHLRKILQSESFEVFHKFTQLSRFPFCQTLKELLEYTKDHDDLTLMKQDPHLEDFIGSCTTELPIIQNQVFDIPLPYKKLFEQNLPMAGNNYFRHTIREVKNDLGKIHVDKMILRQIMNNDHLSILYQAMHRNKERNLSQDATKNFVCALFLGALNAPDSVNGKILLQNFNAADMLLVADYLAHSEDPQFFLKALSKQKTLMHYLILQYWNYKGLFENIQLPEIEMNDNFKFILHEFNLIAGLAGRTLELEDFIDSRLNVNVNIVEECTILC